MNPKKNTKKMVFRLLSQLRIVVALLFCAITAFGQSVPKGKASIEKCAADMPFMLLPIQAGVQGQFE